MSVCLVKVAGSKKGASSGLYCLSSLARHLRTTSLLTFGGILITPTLWPRIRVRKRMSCKQSKIIVYIWKYAPQKIWTVEFAYGLLLPMLFLANGLATTLKIDHDINGLTTVP